MKNSKFFLFKDLIKTLVSIVLVVTDQSVLLREKFNCETLIFLFCSFKTIFFTLSKFKEEQGYNFPLLSDFNKEVSAAYETIYTDWILEMKGVSKRSAFVIDKEGIVRYAQVLENAGELPNFEAIQETLVKVA